VVEEPPVSSLLSRRVRWAVTDGFSFEHALADKGYDSNAFVESITRSGAIAVIPSRSNRKEPREYDRQRFL
jgi:hypothetical protein